MGGVGAGSVTVTEGKVGVGKRGVSVAITKGVPVGVIIGGVAQDIKSVTEHKIAMG